MAAAIRQRTARASTTPRAGKPKTRRPGFPWCRAPSPVSWRSTISAAFRSGNGPPAGRNRSRGPARPRENSPDVWKAFFRCRRRSDPDRAWSAAPAPARPPRGAPAAGCSDVATASRSANSGARLCCCAAACSEATRKRRCAAAASADRQMAAGRTGSPWRRPARQAQGSQHRPTPRPARPPVRLRQAGCHPASAITASCRFLAGREHNLGHDIDRQDWRWRCGPGFPQARSAPGRSPPCPGCSTSVGRRHRPVPREALVEGKVGFDGEHHGPRPG